MVHYFKLAGQRMLLDEASGYTESVDEITYKMLAYLTLPLPKDCPSAIRYDMAKYDSALVAGTYQDIYRKYQAGLLFSDAPFDSEKAVTLLVLSSGSEIPDWDSVTVPVLLSDTDDTEGSQRICREARARGLSVTVCMTKPGDYECDRLLVLPELYDAYQNSAPMVGVNLLYDAQHPALLSRVIEYADRGITLIGAYAKHPAAGEQTALIKELGRVAKELYLRKKEGRPVEFLPFSVQGKNAKHGSDAFANEKCAVCSHRTHCGGYPMDDADCAVKRTCADAAIVLS